MKSKLPPKRPDYYEGFDIKAALKKLEDDFVYCCMDSYTLQKMDFVLQNIVCEYNRRTNRNICGYITQDAEDSLKIWFTENGEYVYDL